MGFQRAADQLRDRARCRGARSRWWPSGVVLTTTSSWPIGTGLAVPSRFSRSTRSPSMVVVEQLVDITAVEVIGEYRLRLTFQDGTVGDVDFADRDWPGVFEP